MSLQYLIRFAVRIALIFIFVPRTMTTESTTCHIQIQSLIRQCSTGCSTRYYENNSFKSENVNKNQLRTLVLQFIDWTPIPSKTTSKSNVTNLFIFG